MECRLHTQGGLFTKLLKLTTPEPYYTDIFLPDEWGDPCHTQMDKIDEITTGKNYANGKFPKRIVIKVVREWLKDLNSTKMFTLLQRSMNVIGLDKTKRIVIIVIKLHGTFLHFICTQNHLVLNFSMYFSQSEN